MDNEAAIKRDLPSDDEIGRLIKRLNEAHDLMREGGPIWRTLSTYVERAARALAAMRDENAKLKRTVEHLRFAMRTVGE